MASAPPNPIAPSLQSGKVPAILASLSDDTHARRRLVNLLDDLDAVIWERALPTGRLTFISRRVESLLGHAVERWMEETELWERVIHPSDAQRVITARREALTAGREHALEYRALGVDGREFWLRDVVRIMPGDDGEPHLARGVLTDITERKKTEVELRRRKAQLEASQRLAHIGSWEWDARADRMSWSDELFRIFGIESDGSDMTFDAYVSRVHPEDKDRVQRVIIAALNSGRPFEFEERVVRPDGAVRWLHSRGEVQFDASGRPARLGVTCHDITELKQSFREKQTLERRLPLLLDSVEEGIYGLDLDGRATFVNRAAARMLGFQPSELMGKDLHGMIHHSSPEGSPMTRDDCSIHRHVRKGVTRHVDDAIFWRSDGTGFPVSVTIVPVQEEDRLVGAVVTFMDLTRHRKAEDEARLAASRLIAEQAAREQAEARRRMLHAIFEQVPALVIITRGPTHVVDMANPVTLSTLGRRSLVGRPVAETVPELVEQGLLGFMDRAFQSGEPHVEREAEAWVSAPGGERRQGWYDLLFQPLKDEQGRTWGVLTHATDITEQVRARHEVESKAAELAELTEDLGRVNHELDQFAYIASHDLKAPLRGMANLTSWLEEDLGDRLTPEIAEYTRLIRERVAHLQQIIDALLEYSRAGRARGVVETVSLGRLVDDVVELLDPSSGQGTRSVEVVAAGDLPSLRAHPLAVRQVMQVGSPGTELEFAL